MISISNNSVPVKHYLSYDTKSAIACGDIVATGCALLNENLGLRVLPMNPDTKGIFKEIGGESAATDDPVVFRQLAALMSDDIALGVRLGDRMAAIDDDAGGALDAKAWGLWGTFADRSRRGIHYYVLTDRPMRTAAKLPDGLGDFKSGKGLIIMSPSPRYSPIDLDAPIIKIPDDSPLWQFEASEPQVGTNVSLYDVTAEDRRDARAVVTKLLKSDYRERIALILAGDHGGAGYRSRSEADAGLVHMATHHLRNHPRKQQVMYALLERYSRKIREHGNPRSYASTTNEEAIRFREQKDAERIERVRGVLRTCLQSTYPGVLLEDVYDPKSGMPKQLRVSAVVAFASMDVLDEYSRDDGWRRFPVGEAAQIFGRTPESIRLDLVAAEKAGLIERSHPAHRHDGGYRCDSLIRPAGFSHDGDDD